MNSVFFNENGILRSGWRAAVFLLSFVFLSFAGVAAALAAITLVHPGLEMGGMMSLVIVFGVSSLVAIGLGWAYGRVFEGLPFRSVGLTPDGRGLLNLLGGSLVGAAALGTAVLTAFMSGGITMAVNRDSSASAIATTLGTTLLFFGVAALSEETLFRGYVLQTLVRARLVAFGIVITSVLFAFAHNKNPGTNTLSWLNTFLAGIWFAAAYIKTRDLWFPLGIHMMWNWLQGPVFGINVSGIAAFTPDPLFRTTGTGPAWLTGGDYGVEGGVACTVAILTFTALIYFLPASMAGEAISDGLAPDTGQ